VSLYSKYNGALTFQNFSAAQSSAVSTRLLAHVNSPWVRAQTKEKQRLRAISLSAPTVPSLRYARHWGGWRGSTSRGSILRRPTRSCLSPPQLMASTPWRHTPSTYGPATTSCSLRSLTPISPSHAPSSYRCVCMCLSVSVCLSVCLCACMCRCVCV
jgi:hypothetical protein